MKAEHIAVPVPASDRMAATLAAIAEALDRMRFGSIQLTVHDGKVMQIDVTERRRFPD